MTQAQAREHLAVWNVSGLVQRLNGGVNLIFEIDRRVIAADEESAKAAALLEVKAQRYVELDVLDVEVCQPTTVESIKLIPAIFIDDAERAILIQRAEAGEDVSAYRAMQSPETVLEDETWNLMDHETRIVLPRLNQRWRMTLVNQLGGTHRWHIIVQRDGVQQDVIMTVQQNVQEDDISYQNRAVRAITAAVNHQARYGLNPAALDGCIC